MSLWAILGSNQWPPPCEGCLEVAQGSDLRFRFRVSAVPRTGLHPCGIPCGSGEVDDRAERAPPQKENGPRRIVGEGHEFGGAFGGLLGYFFSAFKMTAPPRFRYTQPVRLPNLTLRQLPDFSCR